MFIDSSMAPRTGSVRRSGRQVDFLPLENHPAPSNGAGGGVAMRSIDISPLGGVKPALRDPARLRGSVQICSKTMKAYL